MGKLEDTRIIWKSVCPFYKSIFNNAQDVI